MRTVYTVTLTPEAATVLERDARVLGWSPEQLLVTVAEGALVHDEREAAELEAEAQEAA